MRINNKRIGIYIETLYKFLFLGVLFSILLILIPIPKIVNFGSPWYLLIFFVGLIILLPKFGHQIFIYNRDGEVLNIKTEDAYWAKYSAKSKRLIDIPKSTLRDLKIKESIFSTTLMIYVNSKRSKK